MELAYTFWGSGCSVAQSYGCFNRPLWGLSKGFKGFLRPKASETAFMKTLEGCLQSLSIQPGLATLPESSAQEYSSVAQDWALFLHFMADFMGIFGLLRVFFEALGGLVSLKWAFLKASRPCVSSFSYQPGQLSRPKCKA